MGIELAKAPGNRGGSIGRERRKKRGSCYDAYRDELHDEERYGDRQDDGECTPDIPAHQEKAAHEIDPLFHDNEGCEHKDETQRKPDEPTEPGNDVDTPNHRHQRVVLGLKDQRSEN